MNVDHPSLRKQEKERRRAERGASARTERSRHILLPRLCHLRSVGERSASVHRRRHRAEGASQPGVSQATMGLVSFPKVVLPVLLGSCVLSYAFFDLARNRKVFGGTVPHTVKDSEWERETDRRLDAWPREAAGPVVMNPISRQNYRNL